MIRMLLHAIRFGIFGACTPLRCAAGRICGAATSLHDAGVLSCVACNQISNAWSQIRYAAARFTDAPALTRGRSEP